MARRRRHELTDFQWEKIKYLLPGKKSDPGRTASDNRLFIDAVVFVLKTGIPRADLPARYGKADTVYRRFDGWCAGGVWERLLPSLGDAVLEEVQLDSITAKAHAAVDRRGRLLKLLLTPSHKGDAPQAEPLLAGFKAGTAGHVSADAGDGSDAIRRRVRRMGAAAASSPTRRMGGKALRATKVQAPQRHRAVRLPRQALPTRGNPVREERRELRRIR